MNEDFDVDSEDESGGNEWLATYGDLVTLLLCFFVLLFAMSSVDAKKFQAVAASINVAFAGGSTLGMNKAGDAVVDLSELPVKDTLENEIKEEKIWMKYIMK